MEEDERSYTIGVVGADYVENWAKRQRSFFKWQKTEAILVSLRGRAWHVRIVAQKTKMSQRFILQASFVIVKNSETWRLNMAQIASTHNQKAALRLPKMKL